MAGDIELTLEAAAPATRSGEPVACGIPLPRGLLADPAGLRLEDASGARIPVQTRALDRWSDGSLRWVLLRWQAVLSGATKAVVRLGTAGEPSAPSAPIVALRGEDAPEILLRTAELEWRLRSNGAFPLDSVTRKGRPLIDSPAGGFTLVDDDGRSYSPIVPDLEIEESGPLYARVRAGGFFETANAGRILLVLRLHFFASSPVVRFDLTLRNPRAARHPGGFWELGDPGSFFFRAASLRCELPGDGAAAISCSPEAGQPHVGCEQPFELYQDSSGGENWKSRVHLNRFGRVPVEFCGYRLRSGDRERFGRRAEPLISVGDGERTLLLAVPRFWANFPKAIESDGRSLTLHLFPPQSRDGHELQGGEQKTYTFFLSFGPDRITEEPLAWCRSPVRVRAEPAHYCSSGAVPWIVPSSKTEPSGRDVLVHAAIEGPDSMFEKRERIDEYGWRNFGDVYADHEARLHSGPEPLVSHYNNQYDAIAGFAIQFLRSGDFRWWTLMDELAAHVRDIDVYHTDEDKSAYNHAYFWHTFHYTDAGLSTHRGYPRTAGVVGGGPSNEHNYTTGLMLHHFLTGDPQSRETVLELARWVVDMDDGSKSVFRFLSRRPTGLASMTADPEYHGPGRGVGNSINALMDAFILTRDRPFLSKAEELIRRSIHPEQDPAERNLTNVELRWSYVIFLQKLGRYLDLKTEMAELDEMRAWARRALLRYAQWMAGNEYPYLEKPEILEHPTETWAAQDIRKSDVFHYAARETETDEDRVRFLEKARFFYDYAAVAVGREETRSRARPVVILLTSGLLEEFHRCRPEFSAKPAREDRKQLPPPARFVPQRKIAVQRAAMIALVVGLGAFAALLTLVW